MRRLLLQGDMRAWDAKCIQWDKADMGADFCVSENPGENLLLGAEGMKEHEEEEGRLCVEGSRV